jgi:putative tryptophan/tyrosine transport system substrate-binding protein
MRMALVHPGSPKRGIQLKESFFWDRLRSLGWEEGSNLEVIRRYARGRMELFPAFMQEVVRDRVDVIVTASTPGAVAAAKATQTIPIVVWVMGDPVRAGLASSFAHPAGNVTGMSSQLGEGIPGKWLELLQELVPGALSVAVLSNPGNPAWLTVQRRIASAASLRGLRVRVVSVPKPADIAMSMERAHQQAQATVVLPDPIFIERSNEVVAIAAKLRMPTIYGWSDFVIAGGLLSYGPDAAETWDRAAVYVDKILRGANPGDLPIGLPTQLKLSVNLKAAKALGITIPESILLRADEVIR